MRNFASLALIGLFLNAGTTVAQRAQSGMWPMDGGNSGRTGAQAAEKLLSPETVPEDFRFLWKLKVAPPSKAVGGSRDPILMPKLIAPSGFKDFLFWSSADTLYAIDSELGVLLWTKKYDSGGQAKPCASSRLAMLTEPPPVVNFNARRAPDVASFLGPPAVAPTERRLGVAAGGGNFGLKGIYVLTSDGMLHEQVLSSGKDYAPAVRDVPGTSLQVDGLAVLGKTIYATTGGSCGASADTITAVDISSPSYSSSTYTVAGRSGSWLTAPAIAADGTAFVVAAPAASNEGVQGDSVIALDKGLKVKDWYNQPGTGSLSRVAPVVFTYKNEQLVAAPGKNGTIVLLDARSLGGADHHTALSESPAAISPSSNAGWTGLCVWQDADGAAWVYAATSAPISSKLAMGKNSSTPGGLVAFRIDDQEGHITLTAVWAVAGMVNPAPPRVANGVLAALSSGSASQHATLFVLDAKNGQQLYSSKDVVPTFADASGLSIGDHHVFFADHEGTVYSFGFGIEH